MRLAAITILAASAWAACSSAGPASMAPIELGRPFSLRPGEAARVDDDRLRVGFIGVIADSRCPRGEQCIVAGDATVRIWLQQGQGPRQVGDLHTAPGQAQALQMFDHELRLLALAPHPVSGKPMAASEHLATLVLTRASPDR